ncbi:RHS repeat-associated core domain-containing protein [Microbulbifer taiwanensis]|uniref:RHS repeat-associated core domain-containing protein n=1 Tax=Microbulbifer taiwanensis TaxID=986746 RepID=UPI001D011409|nr:RHS repeat-associated core domain-containing protein [Microbulbifer taiwanensis]
MQLNIENRQGVRYRVRMGWAYQAGFAGNTDALQLLESFDKTAPEQFSDRSLCFARQTPDPTAPGGRREFESRTLLDPYAGAPGHLSERQKKIYLALADNRLVIEENPLGEDDLAEQQSMLLPRIRMGLQQIIAEERAEAARIQQEHEQRNALEKVGAYIERGAIGFGNYAWDLAVWTKDVAEVAALISPMRQASAAASAAVDYALYDKPLEQSAREQLAQVHREIVDVLGFDPSKISVEQLEQAFEIAQLVYDEPTLRGAVTQFARDYVKAQHSLELTELAGGGVFEIILTIVLAAVTGGVGAVASMAKNARLLARFKGIGELMMDFARARKQRLALAKTRGAQTQGTKFADLESVDAPESQAPAAAPARKSSAAAAAGGDSEAGSGAQSAGGPSEADKTNSDTGQNQNGETSQCNANACEGGEPINLKTGEERLTLVDAVLDGPLPLTVARTYRSSNPKDFGLGHGWTHTLCERLEYRGKGRALHFHDAEGRVIALPIPGASGRSHNVVERLSLTRITDEHWVIAPYGAPNGVQKHFKAADPFSEYLDLAEVRDGYGNGYLFHYIDGRLICVESSLGEALHIRAAGKRIGAIKKETHDGQIATLASYQYSDEGDLIEAADADGHSERYRYHNHVIKQRTLKSGYSFHFEWDAEGPGARCLRQWGDPIDGQPTYSYQFDWDDDGKGVTVTDTRGGVERYRFNERALPIYHRDPEGGERLYSYNALGQLTRAQLPGDEGVLREEVYEYDSHGRLIKKIDAAGGEHRIEYNAEGQPEKITNPAGHSWQRRYNASGQITETIDPLGQATKYNYNPIGLVGSVTDPLGNATRYLWNSQGRLTAVQDPMGRSQHYRYDSAQRLVEVQHAPNQSTDYEYDAQDRISAVTAPDGARTQYRYNPQGLVAEIVDAEGRSTRYKYDGLSQVRARTNPDGSRLEYHYDGERNLVGLTNEKGERYQLKYDLSERLIEEVGFDGRVTRYAYNRAGHLVSSRAVTDADTGKGVDTVFERDAFGRLLEEVTPDGVTSFRYNRAGQMVEAENAHRKLRWEYDACGRVTADWQDQAIIRHSYDAAGHRIASTLPDGEVLKFSFNPAGQFESLHRRPAGAEAEQLLTSIARDELGREVQRQHGNGLASERDYDPQGRLQKLRLGKAAGPVANPVQKPVHERGYSYNAAGQLAQIEDSLRGTRNYHYDALDRLTQVEGPNPEHFVHDPAHNILAAAGTADEAQQQAGTTEVSGNRLAFRGDTHYRYDVHGNRIAALRGKGQKLQTRYHYNSRQQLVRVEQLKVELGGEEQLQRETLYQYDPLGRRIRKQDSGKRIDFLWDGDVLLRETSRDIQTGQDLKARTYYFEPGTFKPVALSEGGEIYHYHLDHLGTPDALTDGSGEVVWSVSYRTYGNVAIAHCEEIEQPLRFQGQYFDEETGLHYNRFRYYDPEVGQFVTQDPVGLIGGVNNYRYVPNPVAWLDPYGLTCKEAISDPSRLLPAPKDSNPWMPDTPIESDVVGADGLIVYRAHGNGRATGGWVTLEPPPNQAYVRSELAVAPEWNDATQFSKIKLAPGTRYQSGIAGPQNFLGGTGGGHQIQVLNFEDILKQEVLETYPLPE